MRKTIIPTLVAILAVLVVCISACGIDTSTPEGTVQAYLNAWVSNDTDTMASYETDDYSWEGIPPEIQAAYQQRITSGEILSINDLKLKIIDPSEIEHGPGYVFPETGEGSLDDETFASVSASFDIVHKWPSDVVNSQEVEMRASFFLTYINGKWLIYRRQ